MGGYVSFYREGRFRGFVHPGRLTAGTYKSPMKRKEHDLKQTSMIHVPAVNLPGCREPLQKNAPPHPGPARRPPPPSTCRLPLRRAAPSCGPCGGRPNAWQSRGCSSDRGGPRWTTPMALAIYLDIQRWRRWGFSHNNNNNNKKLRQKKTLDLEFKGESFFLNTKWYLDGWSFDIW